MKTVNPKLLVGLAFVIIFVLTLKVINPNRKYSSKGFWATASITDVAKVPEDALKKGNANGSVLMWAAMASDNPQIIKELVARGADINEADIIFQGTPLTAAATHSKSIEIIDELIKLGADMNIKMPGGETVLMKAAKYNKNPGIVEKLVILGANPNEIDAMGRTALDIAISANNETTINALKNLSKIKG